MEIKLDIRWYQWLFGILSLVLLVLLVQSGIATFDEGQPGAFWPLVAVFGIPLVICLYLTFGLRFTLRSIRSE